MANFTKIGIDFNGLSNLEPINITIKKTADEILRQAPIRANELTNNWFGFISSITLFTYLFITLSDVSPFGDFRYTKIRAFGICSAIVSMLGLVALQIGFFNNYYHIVIFIILTMVMTIWVKLEE